MNVMVHGTYVITKRTTIMTPMNPTIAGVSLAIESLDSPQPMYSTVPTGGVISPIHRLTTITTPK